MKPVIVLSLLFLCLSITIHASAQTTPEQNKLISVERIWDRAGHSAFTDLAYFNGKFFCTFREAATQAGPK